MADTSEPSVGLEGFPFSLPDNLTSIFEIPSASETTAASSEVPQGPPDPYRVEIQVHFWQQTPRLAFERADCWTEKGGHQESLHYGSCVFTIMADVDPLPEPSMTLGGLCLPLIALAVVSRRVRKGRKAP